MDASDVLGSASATLASWVGLLITVALFMAGRSGGRDLDRRIEDRDLARKIEDAVRRQMSAVGPAPVPAADSPGTDSQSLGEPSSERPVPEPMAVEEHPETIGVESPAPDAIHQRFFDPETGWAAQLQLDRAPFPGETLYRLGRSIGFVSDRHSDPFVFPADPTSFVTDFAPAPRLFSWLVPATPSRMPALLLRDCLPRASDARSGEPREYIGPDVDADEADRLYREALRYTGSGPVEAWLGWATINIETSWSRPGRSLIRRVPRLAWLPLLTLVYLVLWLRALDLVSGGRWWLVGGPTALDLVVTAVVCAVAAVPAALLFGRHWRAPALLGAVCGALFPLLVIALVVAVLVRLARRRSQRQVRV